MTEFERTLRDHLAATFDDICCNEEYTPAELDAYRLGSLHALEEARALFEVEVAHRKGRITSSGVENVQEEIRRSFAIDWEQGRRPSSDLRVVDEALERELAILDAMADCE